MRHTQSGLAILDFPTMGGSYWPLFNQETLARINEMRFDLNLPFVGLSQVAIHFSHRFLAFLITLLAAFITFKIMKENVHDMKRSILFINSLLIGQIVLGAATVLTFKNPKITSLHVAAGAALLGACFLTTLQLFPLSDKQ